MNRQEAIKRFQQMKKTLSIPNSDATRTIEAIDMAIEALSAEAVHGEWIEVEVFPEVYDIEGVKTWGSEMQCDQCGFRHTAIEGHMAQYNYCPNCDADMRGGKK